VDRFLAAGELALALEAQLHRSPHAPLDRLRYQDLRRPGELLEPVAASPTAVKSVRRSDPMLPTTTFPMCTPIPISTGATFGAPSWTLRPRRLRSRMVSMMSTAAFTARWAWSEWGTGAPK
jgi:hypothetical protein